MSRRSRVLLVPPLLCLLGFVALATGVRAGGWMVPLDSEQADRLYQFARSRPALWDFFGFVTDLGAGRPLAAFAFGVVVWVALTGRLTLALFCAAVMLLNSRSINLLKELFDRARPPFVHGPMNASFPSGHAQGSTVVFGLSIYLVLLCLPRSPFRWVAAGLLALMIVLVGLSRMMLGVHFFSDVLGGLLLGMAWVGLAVAVVEHHRRREKPQDGGGRV